MKDDLRYTPSDCFETFPFPADFETDPALEAAGKEYYEFRAALMVRNNEGLTKTYNRFHDPDETLARHPQAPRAARRDGPRRPRRLRLDRPPARPASSCSTTRRTTTRTKPAAGKPQEALALPLARRLPRRSPRPPAGTEPPAAEEERLSGAAAEAGARQDRERNRREGRRLT